MRKRNSLVCDTLHGNIMVTDFEKKIVSTTVFNRLHNISQNSTAYLTYPTNRTKRFEHSLGTLHLCGIMFRNGVANAEVTTIIKFVECFKKELEDNGITYSGDNGFFSKIQDEINLDLPKIGFNLDDLCITLEEVYFLILVMYQAVRIAALLHDLGHPPFSHVTENALKKVYDNLRNTNDDLNDKQKRFLECIQSLIGDENDIEIHEAFGNNVSEMLLNSIEIHDDIKNIINPVVIRILKSKSSSKDLYPITYVLHSLIANSIDADRLDYISRDSLNSGINVGQLNYSRLLSSIALVEDSGCYCFLINMRFTPEIEEYFSKRLEMYKKVVYHHRVIKTDKLLHDIIVFLVMESFKITYFDQDIDKIWENLSLKSKNLDCLSDWDDAFLIYTVKKIYNSKKCSFPEEIEAKFREFVTNKKEYFSIIKSQADYRNFERELYGNPNSGCFVKLLSNNFNKYETGNILDKFLKIIHFSPDDVAKFNCAIGDKENLIQEVLMIPKKVSNGLSNGYKVYFKVGTKLKIANFDNEISKIKMKLDNDVRDLQKVFIYIRTSEKKEINEAQKASLIKEIINVTNTKLAYDDDEKNGLFVAIDGPNGSGKTTIVEEVAKKFKEKNKDLKVIVTKEPTSTQFGAFTREISNTITGEELARIVNVDRMMHMKEIQQLKKQYDLIISDRYLFSSYILQGIDQVSFKDIQSINSNIKLLPDLQVVINSDIDLIESRLQNKHIYNRLEKNITSKEIDFTKKALEFIKNKKNKISQEILEIKASNEKTEGYYTNSIEVYDKIMELLNEK